MTETLNEGEPLEPLRTGRSRGPWRRRMPFLLLVLVAIVLLATLPLLDHDEAKITYLTAPVSRGNLQLTVSATGTLQPVNQVDVGTEVSGTIRSVAVDYNDRVTRGQVLARLDTEELQAQVLQSEANLAAARAHVSLAQATVEETRLKADRCRTLAQRDMCSQDTLDSASAAYLRAKAELASADAQVKVAGATLDAQRTRLDKAEIRSPVDGLVLARRIEPGQTVAAMLQTPVLFVLAEDLADMELHVDIDEADVGMVREGQTAHFTVDAYPERSFPATITQVRFSPRETNGVVTYEALLSVNNQDLLLRPGMTAVADILAQRVDDAVLVPNAALRFDASAPPATAASPGFLSRLLPHAPRPTRHPEADAGASQSTEHTVWLLRDGEPVATSVRIGLTDGMHTEITAGLTPGGDPVILGQAPAAGP
ncbi:MAG: efflux RND transporter periplasmic adaptor subunit [Pseudomonadales bacterium]|nr:efflux RND transporter periplasmic adaptor subunit [Pseudomonadales bacterium]MCP5185984.1 efflux RND transporter periplasmic adaptor subunit [Pseudomonadales bacterium]